MDLMIKQNKLQRLYLKEKLSSNEIAERLNCSISKVNYWLKKHEIPKRSLSEAMYVKKNPDGDPFDEPSVSTMEEAFLYGMGLGLYWGEGTKSNQYAVRLGNTDPELIKMFLRFLVEIYKINEEKLQFGLQIFGDMNKQKAVSFWQEELQVSEDQFYKVTITPHRGVGNYNKKTKHGVLTIYFNNTKLRDILCDALDDPSLPG